MKPEPAWRQGAGASRPALDGLLAWRGVRHHSLGPTGERLYCSTLDNALGMRGRFHYDSDDQQALADPVCLFVFVNGEPLEGKRASCVWQPSHVRRQTRELALGLVECKFITADDVLCDVLELTNHGAEPLRVRLQAQMGAAEEVARWGKDMLVGQRALDNQRLWLTLAMVSTRATSADALVCDLVLAPGEQTTLMLTLAVHARRNEASRRLARWAGHDQPLTEHLRQYQRWFDDHCPDFACPDENLVRLWWYHWFVLRHNLGAAEGRALPLPALSDLRWLHDAELLRETLHDALHTPSAHLQMPRLVQQALLVQPDAVLTAAAAESCVQLMAALRRERDPDHDLLLSAPPGAAGGIVSVADTADFCASLQATAALCAAAGREVDAQWHSGLAARCREAIMECFWDEWEHSFYSLDEESGEHLRRPEAGNLAPYAYGLAPVEGPYAQPLTRSPEALLQLPGAEQPAVCARLTEALAEAARRGGESLVPPRKVLDCLWLQARRSCEGGDWHRPLLHQYYTSDGSPWGAPDWPQGGLNDLLIRIVAGFTPRADEALEINPLAVGWDFFRFWNVPYRGRRVGVIWESREPATGSPAGLSVWVDGTLAAQSPTLARLVVPLQ